MADTTTTPTTPAATRTIREFLSLHDLLGSLDSHVEVTTDENGKPARGKTTPYTFSAQARYSIIKNLGLTERVVKRVQKARDAKIKELAGGADSITPDDEGYQEKLAALNAELNALLDTEETLAGLRQISIDGLKLEENVLLPNTTIVALGDLVSEPAA